MRSIRHRAFMALFVVSLSGCAQQPVTPNGLDWPPAAAPPPGSPVGDNGIHVQTTPEEVRIVCSPGKAGTRVVDYFITRKDSPSFMLHLESFEESNQFPVVLSPRKFYRGTYEVRAHADKASEPFNRVNYEFEGESYHDPAVAMPIRLP